MNTQAYDLIGDIHGQYYKLTEILALLGYKAGPLRNPKHGESWQVPKTWKHPEGRKVIFLGDYVDCGPNVREVLLTVRGMVEEGDALAIMGDHEYNAVCYYTPDGMGGFLRPHTEANRLQNQATRGVFETNELGYGEWPHWLEWMKRLPLFLDLGNLRCVHACWDAPRIDFLRGRNIADKDFLRTSATKGTLENRAIENVLKGPEIAATEGNLYRDKEGTYRHMIRSRWWSISYGLTIGDVAMPPGVMLDAMILDPVTLSGLPNYGAGEPPVFFGHYWLPRDAPKEPLAPNIGCLDFGAGLDGPLVAYRWDGERVLRADKFVTPTAPEEPRTHLHVDVSAFMKNARHCAMQMMSNATYIEGELPSLNLPKELHARVKALCGSLMATKHDVISELYELQELIEEQGSLDYQNERIERIVSWLREPIQEMHELVQTVGVHSDHDARYAPVFLLLIESATNILDSFSSIDTPSMAAK